MKRTIIIACAGAMAVSGSVHASESDTLKLHEVTVYGTPKAPVELTPLSVSIIDANQIEKAQSRIFSRYLRTMCRVSL